MNSAGSLTVVGSGIKVAAHLTQETKGWLEQAETLLFLVNDPLAANWIQTLNSAAEDLSPLYELDKPRPIVYQKIVARILTAVRAGHDVVALFYGHPGIFVRPAHTAVHQARQEGFPATMLPGISADACLFADLEIDPAQAGCQSYEATDFLIRPRRFDTSSGLLLWQVGVLGNLNTPTGADDAPGWALLIDKLNQHYQPEHEFIIYEAAKYPGFDPVIQRLPLHQAHQAQLTSISTLYIPPQDSLELDSDIVAQLGFVSSPDNAQ